MTSQSSVRLPMTNASARNNGGREQRHRIRRTTSVPPNLQVEYSPEAARHSWGVGILPRLHSGHGAPHPPHPPQPHACGPSHGLPGWLTLTQPMSWQRVHFIVAGLLLFAAHAGPNEPLRLASHFSIAADKTPLLRERFTFLQCFLRCTCGCDKPCEAAQQEKQRNQESNLFHSEYVLLCRSSAINHPDIMLS